MTCIISMTDIYFQAFSWMFFGVFVGGKYTHASRSSQGRY